MMKVMILILELESKYVKLSRIENIISIRVSMVTKIKIFFNNFFLANTNLYLFINDCMI